MASLRDHTPRKETRAAKPGDRTVCALFLDMLAAERGADRNTLGAYGRDLGDFAVYLQQSAAPSPRRRPATCAAIFNI